MSKMPAKKKSCFQITSVTQAQVAASSITDDTESLDDPDESRTEDVSSEIFDVSRADMGVCERSSSEETLNNIGESQEGQPPNTGPVNGGLSYKSFGTGRVTPHNLGGSVPVPATAQPFVSNSATHPSTVTSSVPAATVSTSVAPTPPVSTSCSSRFRVIKLDHGTGEPFRRGRWTCTEFYERDSDSNVNRTVDSIKPTVVLDHSIDRDSGLGATINSVVTSSAFSAQALENTTDSGYSAAGHPAHPHPSEPLHQGYSVAPQIGSGASAFQPTGYTTIASQQPQPAQVNMQPVAPQTFLSNSLNGVHQGAMQQKSPIMPPATQAQQFAYSPHPTGLSAGQPDYRQQHFGSSTQNLPMSALPVGPPTSQIPSPLITSAGPGAQGLGGEAGSAQGPLLQVGNAPAMATVLPGSGQQQHGAHGGATTGLPSGFNIQAEDSRQKSDALPQPSAGVVPGKDGVKPFIGEGLNLPTPAVNSLFGIHITMNVDDDSASGASVVAIDNKIEQAMDLVKSHLMYAVREEVEVLKEHIKELYERNSVLERENAVLKSLANSEQLGQLTNQLTSQLSQGSSTSPPLQQQQQHPLVINNNTPLAHQEGSQSVPHQPNITSA
ncbi:TSC22 domain family protein 2 TSC22-related-inducible leucine zipper protein 4 [Larimichthys crocea]|uniref:TSC22 domain family protein 2 TSC22-related-inducible leucine zipper protein 4 n=1 Tax=Larimichthys crocea TaxID=215358 RepID=A0A6G0IRE1_LARCR|nr:TSC22 domain family protein 2 TSC22-related-inducible leucine zipper protein 4 [Larimichthys crocea]